MKKQSIIYVLVSLIICMVSSPALSASLDYKWFHSLSLNGDVRTVLPLGHGDIWFGTPRGIGRYGDCMGEDISYYLYPKEFGYGINWLQKFDNARILVKTIDAKFYLYDVNDNSVIPFESIIGQWGMKLKREWDLNIKIDNNNDIWCYSGKKLYCRSNNKTLSFPEFEQEIVGIDVNDKELCIMTKSLFYIIDLKSHKILFKKSHSVPKDNFILYMKFDKDGNIWIGNNNLYRYDRIRDTWAEVQHNISVNDMLSVYNGDVIIATNSSGMLVYDTSGVLKHHIEHQPYNPNSILSNCIRSLREASDSTLWICYDKRFISVCDPNGDDFPFKHIMQIKATGRQDNILSISQDKQGKIYFGTDGNGIYTKFREEQFYEKAFNGKFKTISSLYMDSKDCLWVGAYRDGLYKIENNEITHYFPKSSPYSILEDKNGDIWVGFLGIGVYKLSQKDDSMPQAADLSYNTWVHHLAYDNGDVVYAATTNGIFSIDIASMTSKKIEGTSDGKELFNNRHIQAIHKDERGLLWIIGNKAKYPIEIYDTRNDVIIHLPQLDGLELKSIIEDDNNNIWISADKSIVQILVNYDPKVKKYSFYPYVYNDKVDNRISSHYNYRAGAKLNDGRIVFGSADGYRVIDPKKYQPFVDSFGQPKISIKSLMINNKYVSVGESFNGRILLPKDISLMDGIKLNSQENNITLSVLSHDWTSTFLSKKYYRIRNLDNNWLPVIDDKINLTNLAPGIYNLEITSNTPDGNMCNNLNFDIEIKSPWYTTPFAIFIYLIMAIVVLGGIIFYYIDRQKQKLYIKQSQKEVERQTQLNEMKLRFFTNVSHDFRTPLTLIITPLEAYMNDPKNKGDEKILYPIYRNAQRLLGLVNQILDFRKLDVNSTSINLSYGDIVPFVKDICESFDMFAEDSGKRLMFNSERDSINLYFDKDKISKIIMNLLSNAFKFTGHDGVVNVNIAQDGCQLVISVADNGIGVDPEEKEAIFQRFYQRNNNAGGSMGSGIGLHIVKEFAELHNGSVRVTDNTPCGTVFTVRIPLLKSLPEGNHTQSEERDKSEMPQNLSGVELEQNISSKTLLLVDDNVEFLEFLNTQLSDEYHVITAKNGIEAMKILDKNEINIIISDVMMDGMNGFEFCKAVKHNIKTSHIPFILLTAKAMVQDELDGFECGVDEYITKPFNLMLLRHRIRKFFDENLRSHKKFKEKLDIEPSEITITSLDEKFLANAIKCVEDNIDNSDFTVELLSNTLGIHRTYLYKKIVSLTGESPADFIRLIRLKRGAQYLVKSQLYISEIAYKVGYSSPRLFSQHFKEKFGMLPREYQKKSMTGDI